MMSVLIVFVALLSAAHSKKSSAFRVMGGTYIKEYLNGENITEVNLDTMIDVDHAKMLTLPFYDVAYEQNQKNMAFDKLNEVYGQDFTTAIYNPQIKGFMLPNGVAVAPYCLLPSPIPSGYKAVQFDSSYPKRANEWRLAEAGWLMYSFTSGTYGGLRSNFTRFAGDIVVFTDYIFLSPDGNWHKPKNREIIKGFTVNPGRQIINNEGSVNTLSQVEVTDKDGKVGRFVDATFRNKGLNGNWVHTASALWTWLKP